MANTYDITTLTPEQITSNSALFKCELAINQSQPIVYWNDIDPSATWEIFDETTKWSDL